jgi:hypothetical protein
MVVADPQRLEALKADPLPELERLRVEAVNAVPAAYTGDRLIYRIAVAVLGLLSLTAAFGSIILVLEGRTTPEVLIALGSAAVGALVGLFAPSPTAQ